MAAAGPDDDLDQLIRRVDPDRWLTSRFIADPAARADVIALYAFDHELARARRAASTTLLAEIRLTWWREALDEAFAGSPVRRHPVAEALAAAIRRHSLPRAPLEAMIDGQVEALEVEAWTPEAAVRWADAVEGSVAQLAATMLDPACALDAAAPAGRAWGLALLLRSGSAGAAAIEAPLSEAIGDARRAARSLSTATFPAALPVRLARFDHSGKTPGRLAKRWALVTSVATGRL